MRHIGMDRDELLRLKQITGLADLFADKEFSLGDTDEDSSKRCSKCNRTYSGRTTISTGCSWIRSNGWDW